MYLRGIARLSPLRKIDPWNKHPRCPRVINFLNNIRMAALQKRKKAANNSQNLTAIWLLKIKVLPPLVQENYPRLIKISSHFLRNWIFRETRIHCPLNLCL
jgi:hypothetical protein